MERRTSGARAADRNGGAISIGSGGGTRSTGAWTVVLPTIGAEVPGGNAKLIRLASLLGTVRPAARGITTSTNITTVDDAGIVAVGPPPPRKWVALVSASPLSSSRARPPLPTTSEVGATSMLKLFVTSRPVHR